MSFTQGRTGKCESLQFEIKKIDVKGKSIRTYDLHYYYTTLTIHSTEDLLNGKEINKVQIASTPTQQRNLTSFETVLNPN